MLMKVNPFSRNSPTRAVPNRNRPRMTLFLRACSINFFVAASSSGEVYMCGKFVLVVEAHRHAEIVLAEEENVDAGNGGDLGDVLDAGGGFDLQRDDAFVVPVAGVAEKSGFVHAALREVDRARADGGILGATDGFAGFIGGVDVGDEDAVGAHVEGLLDAGAVGVSADADQRLRAAVGDAAQHGGKFFVAHGAMLGVDEQPVVSAVRELFGDGGAVSVEEQAHLGLSGAELLFEFGSAECGVGHGVLLEVELKSVPYGAVEAVDGA